MAFGKRNREFRIISKLNVGGNLKYNFINLIEIIIYLSL
jgi:hypothetical protein